MKIEEMLAELERSRAELHKFIDERMDQFVLEVKEGKPLGATQKTLPMAFAPHNFKGKKLVAVTFPDGQRMEVKTWKELAVAVLQDCIASPLLEERLLGLRGKVMGRQ